MADLSSSLIQISVLSCGHVPYRKKPNEVLSLLAKTECDAVKYSPLGDVGRLVGSFTDSPLCAFRERDGNV